MDIVQTEAIVLNTRDYAESDRLISFYTKTGGKLKGIAKGARRSRKRFVNTFEPSSLVELKYKERGSLVWIDACKLLEPYMGLRVDVERWGYAALVSEIILDMAPEGEPQGELFSLLKQTLSQLAEDRDALNVVLLFIIRFLDIMGYVPSLDECSVCRLPMRSSTRWWWQVCQGELACSEHRSMGSQSILLDLGTLVLIHQARQFPLDRIWRLRFAQEKKLPVLHGLLDCIRAQTRKDLKSLKLLEQVQAAQSG